MDLKGRVAVVTGSGRGIGRALAVEFARHGASVVCCARTERDIQQTAALIETEGGRCLAVQADVADKRQVNNMVEQAMKQFGRVDVLFNNAARIPVIGALWEVDPDAWWDEMTVNLRGPMLCSRAVLPQMIERDEGIIINMAGGTSIPGRTSYCCSKVALGRLTALLVKELESVGSSVVVFSMGPGLVKTKRTLVEAESPQGIRWNPGTKKAFEAGQDRPPEDCARAAVKLIARAGPELNGKFFSASDVLAV
ncbi:MAG TPA: SDR family oxidoreductase [Phycisphaerae bacterium]|nr:SDR family oxidoreductase [Phycisphaerae bacterium]HUT57081.1 SDR family oxidoreductase [Phycisphaerae bacterium]